MSKSADRAAEALQAILAAISRDDLIAELVSREGVACYNVDEDSAYSVQKGSAFGVGMFNLEKHKGPVRIITVDGES